MGPVEHRSHSHRKRFLAYPALPAANLPSVVTMTAGFAPAAIGTHGLPVPPDLLQVGSGLLIVLKRLENFDNVHAYKKHRNYRLVKSESE